MLSLISLLEACQVQVNRESFKIHLATPGGTPPLPAFLEGKFKEWQEEQTAKNFECDHVVSLIALAPARWLFAGVYQVLGCSDSRNSRGLWEYRTTLLPGQDDLVGRVIVAFERNFRQAYVRGERYGDALRVSELRAEPLRVEEFPGYTSVCIPFQTLTLVVRQQVTSWRSALSAVKGVYLVTDRETGKLYVGSATGEEGIWGRWVAYASNGHGGNVELGSLLELEGPGYEDNFQYSILEIADTHTTIDAIVERESHWKRALCSRERGYNSN